MFYVAILPILIYSRDGGAYFALGANKQAPKTLTCQGFWGNSPPEKFEILKFGNTTFNILDEI